MKHYNAWVANIKGGKCNSWLDYSVTKVDYKF